MGVIVKVKSKNTYSGDVSRWPYGVYKSEDGEIIVHDDTGGVLYIYEDGSWDTSDPHDTETVGEWEMLSESTMFSEISFSGV